MAEIGDYRILGKLGEGTFSEVVKVRNKRNNKYYAMKRFKKHFNSVDEIETLREIQALRRLNHHPNIIQLEEVIFDGKYGVLSLAFELMDNNLYETLSRKGFPPHLILDHPRFELVKHSKGIFHRDIKPENILVRGDVHAVPMPFPNSSPDSQFHLTSSFPLVKLADFGSCRGIHSRLPYTEYIATRWYRSPECLLFDGVYTYKMDVWGVGCVFFELITKIPLFPGDDELDQLHKIHHVFGTPSDRLLKTMITSGNQLLAGGNVNGNVSATAGTSSSGTGPTTATTAGNSSAAIKAPVPQKDIFKKNFSFPPTKGCGLRAAFPQHILYGLLKPNIKLPSNASSLHASDFPGLAEECINLLELLLQYDPDSRPTARQALKHPWLRECREAEITEKQTMGLADIPGTSAGQAQQLKSPVATSSLGTSAGASSKQSQATQISVPALQPNGKQLLAGGSSAQRGNQANTTVQPQLFSSVNQAAQAQSKSGTNVGQSKGLIGSSYQSSSNAIQSTIMNSAKNALINASAKRSKNNHEVAPKHGGIEADTGKSPAIHHSFKQQTSIDTASAAMKAASIGSNNSAATIRRTTLNKESSVVSMPPVNGVHQNGGIDLGKGVAALGSQIATDVQPSKTKQQQQHHQKISLIMGGNDPSKSSSTNISKYKTIHVVNSSGQPQQQSLTSIAKKLSLQQAPHTLQPIQSTTTTSSSSSSKNDIQAASKSQQYVVDTSGKNSNVNSGTGAESSTNNLPRKISFSKPDPEASGDANDNIKSNNSNREGVNVDEINEKLRLKRTATPRKRLPVADLPPE